MWHGNEYFYMLQRIQSFFFTGASSQWHKRLTSFITQRDYKQANSDASLFSKQNLSSFTILLVYVDDDVILAGNSLLEMQTIKEALSNAFKIENI